MTIPNSITQQLADKKICILGLGREGLSTYRFLKKRLPKLNLTLADKKSLQDLSSAMQTVIKNDASAKLKLGPGYLSQLDEYDYIFKTPGIPLHQKPMQQALEAGVKISSNLQLFLEIIERLKQNTVKTNIGFGNYQSTLSQPVVIGITGTKGKSTTAALIHHLLVQNKFETILVGNIGQPALDQINQIKTKTKVVIELSSHQLAQLTISPDIAVVQQITTEHLDYFPNEQAYVAAKEAITKYQKVNQYIIFNPQWPKTKRIAQLSPGKKLKFNTKLTDSHHKDDILVYLKSYYLTFKDSKIEKTIIKSNNVPLLGRHNLENIAPAIVIGKLFNLTAQQIANAIKNFEPLPHRLEKVAVKNDITYINDSMATTPEAAISAISCFINQPIILLAGGHEKNQDFTHLAKKILSANVKAVALFPANGPRLWEAVEQQHQSAAEDEQELPAHKVVHSMKEAINFAHRHAQPGSVVLLAPGSASFGIFENYADRGEQFAAAVDMDN